MVQPDTGNLYIFRRVLPSFVRNNLTFYQCPSNLEYSWNFGFLAALYFLSQFLSGIFLVFWYIPTLDLAFSSVDFIMREVHNGWLVRYIHANGASLFFISLYLHIGRNLYFGSYMFPRDKVWVSGMLLFVLVIFTAFLGYVLPWGQMSYWAATVISNMITVVPFFGDFLLIYIWGGLVLEQPTLSRIYGLHFFFPFLILSLIVIHILFLYEYGSNNPLGLNSFDSVPFYPYFFWKDLFGFVFICLLFLPLVFFFPNYLNHPDNYIPANPSLTPLHIVPEWYFLPFYAILRSIPSKIGGVFSLFFSIFILIFLPYITFSIIRTSYYRPFFLSLFVFFCFVYILMGWCGGMPVEVPYYEVSQICSVPFFFCFFCFSLFGVFEILIFLTFFFFLNLEIKKFNFFVL